MNLGGLSGLSAVYPGMLQGMNTEAQARLRQLQADEQSISMEAQKALGRAFMAPQPPMPGQPSQPAQMPQVAQMPQQPPQAVPMPGGGGGMPPQMPGQIPQMPQGQPQRPMGGLPQGPAMLPSGGGGMPAGGAAMGSAGGGIAAAIPTLNLQTITQRIVQANPGIANQPQVLMAALERLSPLLNMQAKFDLQQMRMELQQQGIDLKAQGQEETARWRNEALSTRERLAREAETGRQSRFETRETGQDRRLETREAGQDRRLGERETGRQGRFEAGQAGQDTRLERRLEQQQGQFETREARLNRSLDERVTNHRAQLDRNLARDREQFDRQSAILDLRALEGAQRERYRAAIRAIQGSNLMTQDPDQAKKARAAAEDDYQKAQKELDAYRERIKKSQNVRGRLDEQTAAGRFANTARNPVGSATVQEQLTRRGREIGPTQPSLPPVNPGEIVTFQGQRWKFKGGDPKVATSWELAPG